MEEQDTWAAQKHSEAGYGRPVDRGVWTAKTVKRPRQQPAQPPIRQLLGAADVGGGGDTPPPKRCRAPSKAVCHNAARAAEGPGAVTRARLAIMGQGGGRAVRPGWRCSGVCRAGRPERRRQRRAGGSCCPVRSGRGELSQGLAGGRPGGEPREVQERGRQHVGVHGHRAAGLGHRCRPRDPVRLPAQSH